MLRREFLVSASSFLYFANTSIAWSQDEEDTVVLSSLPPLPADLAANSGDAPAPYEIVSVVGSAKPSEEEVETAYQVLKNSPYGVKPIDVANYFLDVGAGVYGERFRPYAREWPVRANPVIYHFFSATQTKPEGDVTAWCAAFMNWCILRSGANSAEQIGKSPSYDNQFSKTGKVFDPDQIKKRSTFNASSGSFRCWDEIKSPSRGDLVVVADKGTEDLTKSCRGTGHVTFYLGVPKDGWVRVMGGNQVLKGSGGAITVADMKTSKGSRFLKYVAVR